MPPLTTADLGFYLSVPTASAGSTDPGTPGTSLGKYVSYSYVQEDGVPPFSDVTAAEHLAGQVDYRCLFVVNSHATVTAHAFVGLLLQNGDITAGLLERYAFAADNTLATPSDYSSGVQASTVATATTAPSAIGAWSCNVETQASLSRGHWGGADLGLIPPGYCKAFWIRRTAIAAEPEANPTDGATLLLSVTI